MSVQIIPVLVDFAAVDLCANELLFLCVITLFFLLSFSFFLLSFLLSNQFPKNVTFSRATTLGSVHLWRP